MPAWAIEGDLCAAAKFTTSLKGAATLRIAYGCLLEEKAASLPASKCVYFDGYAAAVWTSAHVEYLVSIESGVDQPSQPSINTFPCASSAADVGEFYAHRPSGGGISSKTTGSCLLASLLHRCTNPGSRGWPDILKYGLAHVGVRAFLHHSIVVGLCGTHPSIQPSARPDWKQRMRILRAGTHAMLVDADVVRASLYVKEAVRQSLAGVMATVPATHSALSCLLHPTRHLIQTEATIGNGEKFLGIPIRGEKMAGDTNLRTLRALLSIIDDRGFERSAHQVQFHSAFERSTARVIYKRDWASSRSQIMAKNGWKTCSSEVLISTPRRFGKTFACVQTKHFPLHSPNTNHTLLSSQDCNFRSLFGPEFWM